MGSPLNANLFYPLSPRLTMLLCTIFTQGGADDLPILELLPDDDGYLLQEKAETLLQLDGDKRAAVIVAEMRRQIQFAGLVRLEAIEPTWLYAGIRGEQPLTIGIILTQLTASARSRILSQLPPQVRAKVPAKEDIRASLGLRRIVRLKFESKFVTVPAPPGEPTNFYFKDLVLLEGRELVQLVRALGIEELAGAFLPVGRRKLAELCHRLGRGASEELIAAVRETDPKDAMDLADANEFLSKMLLGLKLDEARGATKGEAKERFQKELFQKAGLFRLARAVRSERPSFVQQLAQRIPRTHGRLLNNYVYRMNESDSFDEKKLHRLQDLVLYRVEKLAARGKVNPRYLRFTFCYWGEEEEGEEEEGVAEGAEEQEYEEGGEEGYGDDGGDYDEGYDEA